MMMTSDCAANAVGVLERVDRLLELVVEDGAIDDDDDGVKLLRALSGIEGGELMRDPGDGVRFAGAGAVLDEVFRAGTFGAGGFDELADDVPLLIAGEDHRLLLIFPTVPILRLLNFEMHEACEDIEQVVGQQHLVPGSAERGLALGFGVRR